MQKYKQETQKVHVLKEEQSDRKHVVDMHSTEPDPILTQLHVSN